MTVLDDAAVRLMARRRLDRLKALDERYGADLNAAGARLLCRATFAAYETLRRLDPAGAAELARERNWMDS